MPQALLLLLLLPLSACSFKLPTSAASWPADLAPDPADLSPVEAAPADLYAPDLLRPPMDLMPPPDLGGPCGSRRNIRLCRAGWSGRCDASYEWRPERLCTGDGCEDGHCRKPASPLACVRDTDCAGLPGTSCQFFTNVFNVAGQYCAPRAGPGANLAPCRQHSDCVWNTCFPLDGGRCLRPCRGQEDCGPDQRCTFSGALIEGFSLTSTFCTPPP